MSEEPTFRKISDNIVTLCSSFTYQSSTTEENHKDNESLKPVVFDNLEAGFSKVPPLLSSPFFYTYLTALEPSYTAFKTVYVMGERFCWIALILIMHSVNDTILPFQKVCYLAKPQ